MEGECIVKETEKPRMVYHLTSQEKAFEVLKKISISYDGEINLSEISFNKVEAEQSYYVGTLSVPRWDLYKEEKSALYFFICKRGIVFVNEDGYAEELIEKMRKKHIRENETKERFLAMFLAEIIAGDAIHLDACEQRLIAMEEEALRKEPEDFNEQMLGVRKQLLALRSYYDQFVEIGRVLEENENLLFRKKELKYFGTFSDRAYRLLKRTIHLIDYANQVKDVYQGKVDERQNKNMQYLSVISTIFFPLTVITGWYGMNFQNMPELESGYPFIIAVSITVIIVCILIFKKKKIF